MNAQTTTDRYPTCVNCPARLCWDAEFGGWLHLDGSYFCDDGERAHARAPQDVAHQLGRTIG